MENSLHRVKDTEPGVRNLVFGFIRNIETMLQFNIIPPLIYHLCLIFYGINDYFHTFRQSHYDYIDQDIHRIIKKNNRTDSTIYGKFILKPSSNFIYEYEFKIIENPRFMVIGIDEATCKWMKHPFYWKGETINYSFDSFGKLFLNGDWRKTKYGDEYTQNDIVTMIIDFKEMKISFGVNDEKYEQISIDSTPVAFRMAIYLDGIGSSLELLSTVVRSDQ